MTARRSAAAARASPLAAIERLRLAFGTQAAAAKRALLRELARRPQRSARGLVRLHEALCFMRAYPDDAALLEQVVAMLEGFARRADLRRHRGALAGSGIAGSAIHYRFFAGQAQWLARRWPRALRLDRDADAQAQQRIARALPVLLGAAQARALLECPRPAYAAIDALRGRDESDAVFLLRRIAALPGNGFTRELLSDTIDACYRLDPGPGTPSRTDAFWAGMPVVWRAAPPPQARPRLREELTRAPRRVRRLPPRDAQAIVELARAAMVTRARSLEAFSFADARDAWWVDDGDGLGFAFVGVIPERRHSLASFYGGLTLRNGVPIGYHQADLLGARAALSFNSFDTFRGAEAAHTFARWLAALHHLFGSRSFSIEPYQLGAGNDEAIESGAWWFYAKLGFAPRDRATQQLARAERERLAQSPARRSSGATLQRLAQRHLYFEFDAHRRCGRIATAALAMAAGAGGAEAGARRSDDLARDCGLASWRGWSRHEREAWQRLAPLLALLDPARWRAHDRMALPALVRSKAAVAGERGFIGRYLAHPRLDAALVAWSVNRRDVMNQN